MCLLLKVMIGGKDKFTEIIEGNMVYSNIVSLHDTVTAAIFK